MPTISDVENLRRERFRRSPRPPSAETATRPQTTTATPIDLTAAKEGGDRRPRRNDDEENICWKRRRVEEGGRGIGGQRIQQQFAYTDVLLQPELLLGIKGDEELSNSSNPLLEMCLDGGYFKPLTAAAAPGTAAAAATSEPPLLKCCSPSSFNQANLETLIKLVHQSPGCDVNVRNSKGLSAMHFLIQGCSEETFFFSLHGIYILLSSGTFDKNLKDHQGNNAVTSVHHLLAKGLFVEAAMLTHVLNSAECDVNHVNNAERTLLSYSVAYGDASAPLTRMLLNFGAQVWPVGAQKNTPDIDDVIHQLAIERERSSFTWLLRSLMDRGVEGAALDDFAQETIYLLGAAMGEEPLRMRSHVTRTMIQLGHSIRAMGPMFQQLKQKLSQFWTSPQPLKYLCLRQIRHSIGPKNLSDEKNLRTLNMPEAMLQYLQLY